MGGVILFAFNGIGPDYILETDNNLIGHSRYSLIVETTRRAVFPSHNGISPPSYIALLKYHVHTVES